MQIFRKAIIRVKTIFLVVEAIYKGNYRFFDREWYLKTYQDLATTDMPAFFHYMKHGRFERRAPNRLCDPTWYMEAYKNLLSGHDFWSHFTQHGIKQNLSPHSLFDSDYYAKRYEIPLKAIPWLDFHRNFERNIKPSVFAHYDASLQAIRVDDACFKLSQNPLVSIIIVNRNGLHHLEKLFQSLKEQSYQNFEIVFIDNASTDGSREFVKGAGLKTKLVELNDNVGYAEGNNIGLAQASGELIALLNNDTRANSLWLESLVECLKRNPAVAAAVPKLLFWKKFNELVIESEQRFSLSAENLLSDLSYKKIFVLFGTRSGNVIKSKAFEGRYCVTLYVPSHEGPYHLRFLENSGAGFWVRVGFERKFYLPTEGSVIYPDVGSNHDGFWIINNAGSFERKLGDIYDRGYGEVDKGQYNANAFVPFLCAAAALVRRDALQAMPIFASDLYCYFEDAELSRRLTSKFYKIEYCFSAVVYHKHASSSNEYSTFWLKQIWRNRALYRYTFSLIPDRVNAIRKELRRARIGQKLLSTKEAGEWQKIRNDALEEGIAELQQLIAKVDDGTFLKRSALRIGIYNSFWNTLGGGEAHALRIAELLGSFGAIELIGEEDFSIDLLKQTFNVSLDRTRKRLVERMAPEITEQYDVFVNATYCSTCSSRAKLSFFIVSFPGGSPDEEFLKSYIFLPNSQFTLNWMHKRWSNKFEYRLCYPAVADDLILDRNVLPDKQKIILAVGRMTEGGHCKNHDLIATVFSELISTSLALVGWKLVIAGSAGSLTYPQKLARILEGHNADIIINATRAELRDLYAEAFIYVHSTGFGCDEEKEPERLEHFGMTVVEALSNGCFVVAFNAGGPKEVLSQLETGRGFKSAEQLRSIILTLVEEFQDPRHRQSMVAQSKVSSERFSQRLLDPELLAFFNVKINRIRAGFSDLK